MSSIPPSASTQETEVQATSIVDFAELRQLTLENGRIIDLPLSVLTGPAPKPIEFLHLQHHFEGHRGDPVDLAKCESADQAIDVLADEIEAIRLLLYGYVVNFKRYVDRFEEAHAKLRREIDGVGESYQGLSKLVAPAHNSAIVTEQKLLALEQRLARLPVGGGPKPPKFKGNRRGGLSNPPLSKEENQSMRDRHGVQMDQRRAINALIDTQNKLADAALLKGAMEPPRANPPSTGSIKKTKGRRPQPLNHELVVKITKVAEDVMEARALLQSAHVVTTNNLAVLRYREDEAVMHARELWNWHDSVTEHPPSLDGDMYAITLDVSCEKPLDELSREEAIEVLKSLPLRVHFVPYVAPDIPDAAPCNGSGKNSEALESVEKRQGVDHPQAARPCPSPGERTPDDTDVIAELNGSPITPDRVRCATKPPSRKRTRGRAEVEADVVEDSTHRNAAGGPPRKKKRGSGE
ncbi:hypothetical protein BN946_scf185016.g25 [Trametes cinnabarina]|uniref:Uncharacterized protein n=1 Tax=Pycnoporus cinnabarinus TaxID=5643 RepID=A0A060SN77_PYCCI|nr:hypothetical protein BN946_scf185016.g25 [Trametes cinnabarina]